MVGVSIRTTGKKHMIHSLTEINVSYPRSILREHKAKHGESLSFTAFLVYGLARVLAKHPEMNAFRKGKRMIMLDDVTVSVLVERKLKGELVPEPLGIQNAQKKSFREIHEEIREAQAHQGKELGSLGKMHWVRHIPDFLMSSFFSLASGHIGMQIRYGVACISAVGMNGKNSGWFIPHGSSTVMLTVGGMVNRPVLTDGKLENQEHLCLSFSFDHAIIDGSPAARFVSELCDFLEKGTGLEVL